MINPSRALYTAEQVRALDRRAIEQCGIPGYTLMCRAAQAAFDLLRQQWPQARSVGVLCGAGNNGGDGYALARIAAAAGFRVQVVALCAPERLTGEARIACDDYRAAGGVVQAWSECGLPVGEVLVDAVLGIGATRDVDGEYAEAINAINASARPVLALDLPSGLHPDTGQVLGCAVRAAHTISFIGRKLGCFVGAGLDCSGRVHFDDLGVPAETYLGVAPPALLIDVDAPAQALPPRARNAHKGRHGHVLVVGGGVGMAGAARLAGEAALRCGAGLVTVGVHEASLPMVSAGRPELMCLALREPGDMLRAAERATVLAIGPGLGTDAWAQGLFEAALGLGLPALIDADALNQLAARPRAVPHAVLTPHPGEAARLLGTTSAAIQLDRLAAARELAARYAATIVLKGAGSIVQAPGATPQICDRGNPGMAVAGMGDVLSGVIAAMLAQGAAPELAAAAGVLIHARAGDRAAGAGERGLLAGDVLAELRACVNPPWC